MLHPQARALIDLMDERSVPPTHTLNPTEARHAYRDRRAYAQPSAPDVTEVVPTAHDGETRAFPAGD